jgi:hypothetical protein
MAKGARRASERHRIRWAFRLPNWSSDGIRDLLGVTMASSELSRWIDRDPSMPLNPDLKTAVALPTTAYLLFCCISAVRHGLLLFELNLLRQSRTAVNTISRGMG